MATGVKLVLGSRSGRRQGPCAGWVLAQLRERLCLGGPAVTGPGV